MKIASIIIAVLMLFSCSDKNIENASNVSFPTHIYLEKKSPDGKINAVIYSWSDNDKENFLGTDDRFILGFISTKSKWYIDYELSEGKGTYEGGITEIKWLNNYEILIKRRIDDSPKDIKYNIRSNEWKPVKEENNQ